PRVGCVQASVSNRVTWYGKPGGFFEQFLAFGTLNGLWNYHEFFSAHSVLEDHASAMMSLKIRGGWSVGMSPRLSSYAFDPTLYTNLYNSGVSFRPSNRLESLVS